MDKALGELLADGDERGHELWTANDRDGLVAHLATRLGERTFETYRLEH